MTDRSSSPTAPGGDAYDVLFVGKYTLASAAGDSVSVRRLTSRLAALGVRVRYAGLTAPGTSIDLPDERPRLVHALNSEAPATLARSLAAEWGIPLVVTTTGTDLNRGLGEPTRRAAIIENLRAADRVISLTAEQEELILEAVPEAEITRVVQGITLAEMPFNLRSAAGASKEDRIALMLGGLRPVKGHRFALDAWSGVPDGWHLVIAGDAVDPDYADEIKDRGARMPHVTVLDPVAHDEVMAALCDADVLLNTSQSEGESRAILESMAMGTPVVARRNLGNEGLIEHRSNGLLFRTEAELQHALTEIAEDPTLYSELAEGAKRFFAARSARPGDAETLAAVYADLGVHVQQGIAPVRGDLPLDSVSDGA